ncbi:hypothetical protein PoHVEF18_005260 [Penicillium ochrochloron]
MTTPACHNFAGIAINRFLLGLVEAVVNPGFVLMMSMWYTTREQPLRLESYYCTNGIATMFGGLIGYAVGHISTGLPRWMYVFLIFGAFSVVTGIFALWLLPDLPSTAKFLSERERAIAVDRVAINRQGVKSHKFKWYQVWQAARDPKTWLLFIMAVGAQVPNSALTSFTSIIVGSFGFDTLGTQYLQIPGGAVNFLTLIIGGWIATKYADKFHSRSACMIIANLTCILGSGLLVGLPSSNKWGRLVALWLCYFQGLGFSMSLTIVSSNIAGYTKKQVTGALLFTGYCVGNIIGPQTFKDSEAPGYHSAYIAMLAGYAVKTVSIVALYFYMYLENKRRDRAAVESQESEGDGVENGMLDQTEIDNKAFRYVLTQFSANRAKLVRIRQAVEACRVLEPLPVVAWGPLALAHLGVPILIGIHILVVRDEAFEHAARKLLDSGFKLTSPNRNPAAEILESLPDPEKVLEEIHSGYKSLDQSSRTFDYPAELPERKEQLFLIQNSFSHFNMTSAITSEIMQPTEYDIYRNILYPLERALVESLVNFVLDEEGLDSESLWRIMTWSELLRAWISIMVGYLTLDTDIIENSEDRRAATWYSMMFGRIYEEKNGPMDRRVTKRLGSGEEMSHDMSGAPI